MSRVGTRNYIPQILRHFLTCPYLWYYFCRNTSQLKVTICRFKLFPATPTSLFQSVWFLTVIIKQFITHTCFYGWSFCPRLNQKRYTIYAISLPCCVKWNQDTHSKLHKPSISCWLPTTQQITLSTKVYLPSFSLQPRWVMVIPHTYRKHLYNSMTTAIWNTNVRYFLKMTNSYSKGKSCWGWVGFMHI